MSSGPDRATESLLLPTGLVTPVLVVDVDILERNIAEMASICREAGIELWPHAKTHRTVEYARRQLMAGAAGLTVARLDEAETFADAGATRLLVGYSLVGEEKLARAWTLAQRIDLTLAADGVAGAREIGRQFTARGSSVRMLLIINTGMDRCGVELRDAPSIAREIAGIEGVQLRGIMTHEGSVTSVANHDDLVIRSRQAAADMVAVGREIAETDQKLETISLGCSASARIVAQVPGVTQLRPGRYAFNDFGQMAFGNATAATCAARVVATVISRPTPKRALIDAGSKSLSSDALSGLAARLHSGYGLVAQLPGWELHRLSEEHGWLRWIGRGAPTPLEVGQQIQIIPNHICSVFWNMGVSTGISKGELVGSWRIIDRNT